MLSEMRRDFGSSRASIHMFDYFDARLGRIIKDLQLEFDFNNTRSKRWAERCILISQEPSCLTEMREIYEIEMCKLWISGSF